ncbi:MAG: polyketide beta-ketoacyl:ACP synthase [Catenulispora sp.]|nr:polyketide beta-ketoacyl:ACP synthase [Catenulispora sp.]
MSRAAPAVHAARAAPAVITGIGVLCPIAPDPARFTEALRAGRTAIAPTGVDVPAYTAPLPEFVLADALADVGGLPTGLAERALRVAGRSPLPVRAATVAALQAWQHAELPGAGVPGDRVGLVVAGHNLAGRYVQELRPAFERDPAHLSPRFALHCQDTDHVGTLSEVLEVTGEGFTVGAASASGAFGVVAAARLIACAAVDVCVVVGALCRVSDMEAHALANLGALARAGQDAPGAPFDVAHRGFVPGEAAAALVLESAEHARARGVRALAGLAGYGAKLDGNRLADPSAAGEAAVMRAALAMAGLQPGRVGYVNAHATGAPRGDAAELAALAEVFGPDLPEVRVNSTKSLTGHCLAAAGVLEAVATVVQLREGFLHPIAGLVAPVPTGCRLVTGRTEPVDLACALSNSFGFGGMNASLLFTKTGA